MQTIKYSLKRTSFAWSLA